MTLSPHKGKPPSIPPKGGGMDDPQPPKGAEGWLMGLIGLMGLMGVIGLMGLISLTGEPLGSPPLGRGGGGSVI